MAQVQEIEKSPGFFDRVRNMFHSGDKEEEAPTYSRRLLDGKIERYLDEHFSNYVDEYNLVSSLDLTAWEERVNTLEPKVSVLSDFVSSTDADLSDLERRVKEIKSAAKKGGSSSTSSSGKK